MGDSWEKKFNRIIHAGAKVASKDFLRKFASRFNLLEIAIKTSELPQDC